MIRGRRRRYPMLESTRSPLCNRGRRRAVDEIGVGQESSTSCNRRDRRCTRVVVVVVVNDVEHG